MPSTQAIIGRVGVKVLPDTKDFRREAEKALGKIEKTIKVSIPTMLDMTGAKRDMLEQIRKINQENRSMDSRKIRFHTTISRDTMNETISRAVRQLNERAAVRKIKFGEMEVELALDQSSKDLVQREIEHFKRANDPVHVDVVPQYSATASAFVHARLAILTHLRTVKIVPYVDPKAAAGVATVLYALSGGRMIVNIFDNIWDSIKNLDKAIPLIALIAESIVGLSAWSLAAASNIFALGSSFAAMVPAALALPGILGGMAVSLGVVVIALADFKKQLPGVVKQFNDMKKIVSENFWDQARKGISELATVYLPHLGETAKAVGGFFGAMSSALAKPFESALGTMFDNLNKSIEISSKGVDAFANIIVKLGLAGSEYLPRLAKWFNDVATQFSNFLNKASKDGSLKGWIDNGIEQMSQLGRIVKETYNIFGGLADAANAAGGSSFSDLADTLARISAVVNGANFQESLTQAFRAAHEAMTTIATISGPSTEKFFLALSDLFVRVFPVAAETIGTAFKGIFDALSRDSVSDGVMDMFTGLRDAFTALAPYMPTIGDGLGELMSIIGELGRGAGPSLALALGAVAEYLVQWGPVLRVVTRALSGGLLKALELIEPILPTLVAAFAAFRFGQFVAGVYTTVTALYAQIASAVETIAIMSLYAWEAVKSAAKSAAAWVASVTQTIAIWAMLAASAVANAAKTAAAWVANNVRAVASMAVTAAAYVAGWALMAVQATLNAVRMAAAWLIAMGPIGIIVAGVIALGVIIFKNWDKIVAFTKAAWGFIKSFLLKAWGLIKAAVVLYFNIYKTIITKVWNAVKKVFTTVWNFLKGFVQKVWAGIKSAVQLYFNVYKTIISNVWNAIKGVTTGVWNALKGFLSGAWSTIKSKLAGAFSAMVNVTREGWSKIKQFFTDAIDRIKAIFNGAKDILVDAGKAIIQGLLDGIQAMWDKVKGKFNELTDMIPDWKGPRDKDKKLLYKAGQLIIGGLVKGLDSKITDVRSTLKGLTSLITKDMSKNLRNVIEADRQKLLKLLKQYENAGEAMKKANEKLKALQQESRQYAQGVKQSIIETGNVTGGEDSSFAGIVAKLTAAKQAARQFADVLKGLGKAGLNKTALDQIAQAGPEAGLAAAQSILEAGKKGINEINALQTAIAKAGGSAGQTAADAMFKNGINIAEGLVKGLKAGKNQIKQQMVDIAREMVKTIKKELGIKSPSRVFAGLGTYVGMGFVQGLDSQNDKVKKALLLGLDRPDIAARLAGTVSKSSPASGGGKVLNYYAAPGSSINSEEDFFAATSRARAVGW